MVYSVAATDGMLLTGPYGIGIHVRNLTWIHKTVDVNQDLRSTS